MALGPRGDVSIAGPGPVDHTLTLDLQSAARLITQRDRDGSGPARWVWWSAEVGEGLLRHGCRPARVLDLAQGHLLLAGGSDTSPERVWAAAMGLSVHDIPARARGDLFDLTDPALGDPRQVDGTPGETGLDPAGYLLPSLLSDECGDTSTWARLALRAADGQLRQLGQRPRARSTAFSESGAAVLCHELEREGLPIDRTILERLVEDAAGPRPRDPAHAMTIRAIRDRQVLDLIPPGRTVDLRHPEQVLAMLRTLGVRTDSTRKWDLQRHLQVHPVVPALLRWRADERIATTYGWSWMEHHVGQDDRLRGRWHPFDGGAGRMTAEAGLHNLPTALRPAVRAHEGYVFVRAYLGQVEPRVLAVVSGDPVLTAATGQDDLYSTVASQLGVSRDIAKVAVLSAMYGGAAGQAAAALRDLDRTYPVAMAALRAAQEIGERGGTVTTYGGRAIHIAPATDPMQARARGRFARNAVIQGAAAELFKAWALTVRHAVAPWGGRIVLCLHDELLVHVREEDAARTVDALDLALQDTARRWATDSGVRFVADIRTVRSWAEAKG